MKGIRLPVYHLHTVILLPGAGASPLGTLPSELTSHQGLPASSAQPAASLVREAGGAAVPATHADAHQQSGIELDMRQSDTALNSHSNVESTGHFPPSKWEAGGKLAGERIGMLAGQPGGPARMVSPFSAANS